MKNDILLHKQILEMPKLKMNINAQKIFYCVLQKKIREFFSIETAYEYENFNWEDIDECRLQEVIEEEVIIDILLLKKIFPKRTAFKQMCEKIEDIKKEVKYDTYYKDDDRIKKYETIILPLFEYIKINWKNKYLVFKLNKNMLQYITNLKKFAVINIDNLVKLNTSYEIRLYEYICENNYYDKNGKKLIKDDCRKIKVENFKKYMGINEDYRINNIDNRVLKPAIKGLNKIGININVIKLKLDSYNKNIVSHYRIDII